MPDFELIFLMPTNQLNQWMAITVLKLLYSLPIHFSTYWLDLLLKRIELLKMYAVWNAFHLEEGGS